MTDLPTIGLRATGTGYAAGGFSVVGDAALHADPYARAAWIAPGQPDVFGPDFKPRADGVVCEGSDYTANDIRCEQIPGTAIRVSGLSARGGNYRVKQAVNGVYLGSGDGKFHDVYLEGIVKDGLTLAGQANVVIGSHIAGADRACVIAATSRIVAGYHEAARIGTDILPGADCSHIAGLDVGPATCWERCINIGSSGNSITGIRGSVRGNSAEHPDSVGIDIASGLVHEVITGSLQVQWRENEPNLTCDVLRLRGSGHVITIHTGWNAPTNATACKVLEPISNCDISIIGSGDGGTVFDAAILGSGNRVRIAWRGTAVRYKGKLSKGNELTIDGVKQ